MNLEKVLISQQAPQVPRKKILKQPHRQRVVLLQKLILRQKLSAKAKRSPQLRKIKKVIKTRTTLSPPRKNSTSSNTFTLTCYFSVLRTHKTLSSE